jgi:TRAP-type mannitol/chloroaromatic compound transport system substrate-binding protein
MTTMFRVTPNQRKFAQMIAEASDGELLIRLRSRESRPLSEVVEEIGSGKVEMGWGNFLVSPPEREGASRVRKVPAADFLIMPFGLTAQEHNGWIEYGGGLELVDRIFEQIGCKYLPAGNTGMQMGGWYAREINTIDDLKGLKIRISGFGAAVMKAVGAEPYDVAPWSDDARRSVIEGRLDAFERGGPASDLAAGLHKLGKYKYYYYPDWHEPSVPKALFINRAKWNALPSRLQAIISAAATWLNYHDLIDRTARNGAALVSLVQEHGVQVRQFPETVLRTLASVSDRILRERAAQDQLSQDVFDSIMQFRQNASRWAMVSLQPFLTARGAR